MLNVKKIPAPTPPPPPPRISNIPSLNSPDVDKNVGTDLILANSLMLNEFKIY